jgi:hypothetical protein
MQDDTSAAGDAATKLASMAAAEQGMDSSKLATARALERLVLEELGVTVHLTEGTRVTLLRTALVETIAAARRQARADFEGHRPRQAMTIGSFQVTAAGELLGITDEGDFLQIRDERCRILEASWEELIDCNKHKGPVGRRRLRAALWIGLKSGRSVERNHQPALRRPLESALRGYVSSKVGREHLVLLLSGSLTVDEATTGIGELTPPWRQPRRWPRLTAGVVVAVVSGPLAWQLWPQGDAAPPSSAPEGTPGGNLSMKQRLEASVEPCKSLDPASDLASELRSRRQVVVDGRCDKTLIVRLAPMQSEAAPRWSGQLQDGRPNRGRVSGPESRFRI